MGWAYDQQRGRWYWDGTHGPGPDEARITPELLEMGWEYDQQRGGRRYWVYQLVQEDGTHGPQLVQEDGTHGLGADGSLVRSKE